MIKLDVPYRSQRNNFLNPNGACNVTSLAMCLLFLGVQPRHDFEQFEDELYQYAIDHGIDRHDGCGLTEISANYGISHTFTKAGNLSQLEGQLDAGKPAIVHGYFTSFGHIITAIGYDDDGLIVHDPYGEWHDWGYDLNEPDGNNTKGKGLHYSFDLIESTCLPDGKLWLHSF